MALASVATACNETAAPVGPTDFPEVVATVAAANPTNVLSSIVTVEARGADSVVAYFVASEGPVDLRSEAAPTVEDRAVVPLLGLLPDTDYTIEVVAYGGGATARGSPVAFTTGSLPSDLPSYTAGGSDPSPGFVAFAAGRYGIVIDNTGRVVWYHAFAPSPGLNFQPLPNGRFAARPPPLDAVTPASWVEIDPLGNVTRTLGCTRGLQPRFHDLIAEEDGDHWVMCDEARTMDLTAYGGSPQARVTGTVVQHASGSGELLFEWSPFDHFEITDLAEESRTGPDVNWTHGNALHLDTDGNLVVSFRSLSELTKIDVGTGDVLWRMGGIRNQFVFIDSPAPPFARQHGLRVTGPGRLLLLDNSGDSEQSRAERYAFDAEVGAARLIGSYGSSPGVIAHLGGTTQDLPGGRTLVAFGDGGRVEEYDAQGNVVWRIEGDPGYVFRAHRIASLYRPGAPLSVVPAAVVSADGAR